MLRMHSDFLREEVALAASLSMPGFDPFAVDPADAARMTRTQWQMPSGPARSIVRWVEAAGSVVLMADLGNQRVDGLSQWTADHPVIMVNSGNPTDRIRWTLAHEIGHLVLHREDATDDMEREADAFAAEFLMPEALIGPELANLTLGKAVDLKREWAFLCSAHPARPPVGRTHRRAPSQSVQATLRARLACPRTPPATRSHPSRPNSSTTSAAASAVAASTTPRWHNSPDTGRRARTGSCRHAAGRCTPSADDRGGESCPLSPWLPANPLIPLPLGWIAVVEPKPGSVRPATRPADRFCTAIRETRQWGVVLEADAAPGREGADRNATWTRHGRDQFGQIRFDLLNGPSFTEFSIGARVWKAFDHTLQRQRGVTLSGDQ